MTLTRSRAVLAAPLALATLLLAGCSGSATADTTTAATTAAADTGQAAPGDDQDRGGISGEIASVTDTVLQVQDDDGQTAVSWTDATTFSRTAAGTLADVTVGACVVAITASTDGTTTGSATSVQVTAAVDGECSTGSFGGAGGRGGAGAVDMPTDMPTDGAGGMPTDLPTDMAGGAPTGMPTDGAGGMGGFGAVTAGLVSAVDGSTITVEATGTDGTTTTETVTVDDATTYTATVAADSSAVVVGLCASAQGEADSSGAVAATSITVSDPTDGSCSTGFAAMGAGRGGDGSGDSADA